MYCAKEGFSPPLMLSNQETEPLQSRYPERRNMLLCM